MAFFGSNPIENFRKIHEQEKGSLFKKKQHIAKKVKIDWSKADSMKAKPNPNYYFKKG